jgi:polyhydroxyalkanoate synthase
MDLGALGAGMPGAGAKPPELRIAPEKLQALQKQYLEDAMGLFSQGTSAPTTSGDKRFAGDAWAQQPGGGLSAAVYLLNNRTMMGLADAVEPMPRPATVSVSRLSRWMAAAAPSNFLALNAEAQKKAIDTKGESIAKGMQNLVHDMRQGHVSMTDESLFEVGKNVATTEGAVVFENALFQLIEYKPLTAKVYERPFLMVPPCINKFYILDLQPENSLVRYAVEQGTAPLW